MGWPLSPGTAALGELSVATFPVLSRSKSPAYLCLGGQAGGSQAPQAQGSRWRRGLESPDVCAGALRDLECTSGELWPQRHLLDVCGVNTCLHGDASEQKGAAHPPPRQPSLCARLPAGRWGRGSPRSPGAPGSLGFCLSCHHTGRGISGTLVSLSVRCAEQCLPGCLSRGVDRPELRELEALGSGRGSTRSTWRPGELAKRAGPGRRGLSFALSDP